MTGHQPAEQVPAWLTSECDQLNAAIRANDGAATVAVLDRINDRDPQWAASIAEHLITVGTARLVEDFINDALDDTDGMG